MLYKRKLFETKNTEVVIPIIPHVDRLDGGHIVVVCKKHFVNFHDIPDANLFEMIKIGQLCGESLKETLTNNGIPIGLINYQINGNWSVNKQQRDPIHLHVYGRSLNSKYQKYGQALVLPDPCSGFYDGFKTIKDDEADAIAHFLQCYKWG